MSDTTQCLECGLEIFGKDGTRISENHRDPCKYHPAHLYHQRVEMILDWHQQFLGVTQTYEDYEDLALDLAHLWPAILSGGYIEVVEDSSILRCLREMGVTSENPIWQYIINIDDPDLPTEEEQAKMDRQTLEGIAGILWPDEAPDASWSPDTLDEIARVLENAGYMPENEFEEEEDKPVDHDAFQSGAVTIKLFRPDPIEQLWDGEIRETAGVKHFDGIPGETSEEAARGMLQDIFDKPDEFPGWNGLLRRALRWQKLDSAARNDADNVVLTQVGWPEEGTQIKKDAPDFIIHEVQGPVAYDICDECGASLPREASSIINKHHFESCSCYQDEDNEQLGRLIFSVLEGNAGYCLDNIAERASLTRSLRVKLAEFFNFTRK